MDQKVTWQRKRSFEAQMNDTISSGGTIGRSRCGSVRTTVRSRERGHDLLAAVVAPVGVSFVALGLPVDQTPHENLIHH